MATIQQELWETVVGVLVLPEAIPAQAAYVFCSQQALAGAAYVLVKSVGPLVMSAQP